MPLCRGCHDNVHREGRHTFVQRRGLKPLDEAAKAYVKAKAMLDKTEKVMCGPTILWREALLEPGTETLKRRPI